MSHSFGITEYPNTFKRQGSFPLDNSSVFNSLNEAITYANSSPIAYEGQMISVIENNKVTAYVLEKSTESEKNYKLASITADSSLNDVIVDMNNLINSKVGIWSITRKLNTTEAVLDFDILYSADADSYEVFFNEESISNILSLDTQFITDLEVFRNSEITINIKFYNNGVEAFELKAKPLYMNSMVIFGSLYLIKLS